MSQGDRYNMERFYSKTKRVESGCLEWQASVRRGGYGQFNTGNGRIKCAHRFAWELVNGEIPKGMFVCHTCDNPRCVEVSHLFLGTPLDNTIDMVDKGRHKKVCLKGTTHGMSKITDKEALQIFNAEGTNIDIALEYGISNQQVSNIKLKKSWTHVTLLE